MNEERFTVETKKIQSVIAKASQKAGALSALSDGGKMSREKLQLTLEETAYFFESATLYLRALCETQMPGIGGYGRRDGLEFQLPSGHIEIAGAGWVHMQIDTLLPHCRYMPATWLTDTVRQLLTSYMQHTNFRLHFKQMLLVIDDDDQYHLSVHMMSSRSAENVCHISLVLPESAEEFFRFHQKGIAYSPLEPSVMVNFSLVSEASSVPATC